MGCWPRLFNCLLNFHYVHFIVRVFDLLRYLTRYCRRDRQRRYLSTTLIGSVTGVGLCVLNTSSRLHYHTTCSIRKRLARADPHYDTTSDLREQPCDKLLCWKLLQSTAKAPLGVSFQLTAVLFVWYIQAREGHGDAEMTLRFYFISEQPNHASY